MNQVKKMNIRARTSVICKKVGHIELQLRKKCWKNVQDLAEDVIPKLEQLKKQSGQAKEAKADICKILERVFISCCNKKSHNLLPEHFIYFRENNNSQFI